jgi:two-component system sensor histidine kinase ChvG
MWRLMGTQDRRVKLAIPEMLAELAALPASDAPALRASGAGHEGAARTHVQLAQRLVSRALDASRGEATVCDPVPAAALIDAATRAARDDPATRLSIAIDPPDLVVHGDELLLTRALENLVDNARDVARAARRDVVDVRVSATRIGAAVELRVEDDGPGIDPTVRDRLFEALATARPGGTGLGLRFVRAVAERHGGAVDGRDREGGGATFALPIPEPGRLAYPPRS